jgi:hypothetical protein
MGSWMLVCVGVGGHKVVKTLSCRYRYYLCVAYIHLNASHICAVTSGKPASSIWTGDSSGQYMLEVTLNPYYNSWDNSMQVRQGPLCWVGYLPALSYL